MPTDEIAVPITVVIIVISVPITVLVIEVQNLRNRHPRRNYHYPARALRAKGPRAESARAVTGRRCPHSGRGDDFLSRQPDFFTESRKIVSKVGN